MDINILTRLHGPGPGGVRPGRAESAPPVERADLDPQQAYAGNEAEPEPARARSEAPAPAGRDLDRALDELNHLQQTISRELRFSVDRDAGRTVVAVIDKTTDEVIRQIPSEVALRIASAMQLSAGSLLQDEV